jgi:hypothetical protein
MNKRIANSALRLAMEWGAAFMKPTQPRMKAKHPKLTSTELDEYDAMARAAMTLAHGHVYDQPDGDYEQYVAAVRGQFAWVSDDNLARLHSQGVYYAHN